MASDGKTSDGKTSDGKTSDGKTSHGKTSHGKTSHGKTSHGVTSGGETSGGETNGEGSAGTLSADLRFLLADYDDPRHAADLIELLDDYARDPTGGGEPLEERVRERLVAALARTPNAFTILGYANDRPVAVANCFETLSTFAARPLVNVHDLAVASGHRGLGIGRALLAAIEAEARARGACKVTLEVLEGNEAARRAYERVGFRPYVLDETLGSALFLQKALDAND